MLVLQHPQEQDRVLGTARLLAHSLTDARVSVGLSWRNLGHAISAGTEQRTTDPRQWGVLYLGGGKVGDNARRLCQGPLVAVDNLGGAVEAYLSTHFQGFPNGMPPPGLYHRILKEIEVPLLTAALAATRGNQIRAADLLGLNRNTLRKKIRDLDIQVYRSGG